MSTKRIAALTVRHAFDSAPILAVIFEVGVVLNVAAHVRNVVLVVGGGERHGGRDYCERQGDERIVLRRRDDQRYGAQNGGT